MKIKIQYLKNGVDGTDIIDSQLADTLDRTDRRSLSETLALTYGAVGATVFAVHQIEESELALA